MAISFVTKNHPNVQDVSSYFTFINGLAKSNLSPYSSSIHISSPHSSVVEDSRQTVVPSSLKC